MLLQTKKKLLWWLVTAFGCLFVSLNNSVGATTTTLKVDTDEDSHLQEGDRILNQVLNGQCGGRKRCARGLYCSKGVCKHHGFCSDRNDCFNPSNIYNSAHQQQCSGRIRCRNNQCGVRCGVSPCPRGQPVARCIAPPCNVQTCSERHVACVNEYCGGCKARFYNARGNRVCIDSSNGNNGGGGVGGDDGNPGSDLFSCGSDNDCARGEYCGGGFCRENGTCRNVIDCINPENRYAKDVCHGYVDCNGDGRCQKICSSRRCPPGMPIQSCAQSQCRAGTCNENAVKCQAYQCAGNCEGIFFNGIGDQVCVAQDDVEQDVDPTANGDCENDFDCDDTHYCAQGACLPHGRCNELLDCVNPANDFRITKKCAGYLSCRADGVCDRVCGAPCPPGLERADCPSEFCYLARDGCTNPFVSCEEYKCGACNAVFFTAAGFQTCGFHVEDN